MTTTFDAIRTIIVRDFELPAERLQRDTLLEEIELDSLAITELVFAIEDEFRITAENTIPPFKTLGDIADYVARVVADRDTKPRVADKLAEGAAIPSKAAATAATLKGPQAAKKANGKANGGANGAKLVKGARAARPAQAEPSQDAPRKPKRAGGSRVGARAR